MGKWKTLPNIDDLRAISSKFDQPEFMHAILCEERKLKKEKDEGRVLFCSFCSIFILFLFFVCYSHLGGLQVIFPFLCNLCYFYYFYYLLFLFFCFSFSRLLIHHSIQDGGEQVY
jgi:hypothetical protein